MKIPSKKRTTTTIGARKITFPTTGEMNEDLASRLRIRATIRRQIPSRKSVQEGKPDRIADLLEEAATEIERLRGTEMKRDKIATTMIFSLYAAVVVGWLLNAYSILFVNQPTALIVGRVIGAIIYPIGAVMGYFR